MSDTYEFLKAQKDAILAKKEADENEWLKAAAEDIAHYKQERDLALAECERLRADAERLDFVLDNCAFIQTTASEGRPNTYQLLTQDEDENYIELSGEGAWFPTPRAAIDAARGKP